MPGFVGRVLLAAFVLLSLLAAIACAPSDPAERVAAARGDYEVQLSGWIVRPPEPPPEAAELMPGGEEEGAADVTDGEEGEMEEIAELEPDPRDIKILFDILILFSGRNPLPGITVDISHADADGTEKAVRQHYVELERALRGSTLQLGIELDGWALADGDQFSVEVRKSVPEAERGAYREFQEAG